MDNTDFPFIGGAYAARSKNLNAQVCQNLYLELDKRGGKNTISLTNTPGLKLLYHMGITAEIRAVHVFKNKLYVVAGNSVYSLDSDYKKESIGTIGTLTGWCDVQSDALYLTIYDSSGGWVWNETTFEEITLPESPSSATEQDGYNIVSEVNSNRLYLSPNTLTHSPSSTWDANRVIYANGKIGNVVSTRSVRRNLWILGEKGIDVMYNSGTSAQFETNPGGLLEVGCKAQRSVSVFEDTIFWLDDKCRIVRGSGIQYYPVSTYQIDYQISLLSNHEDAVGFCYHQEGHVFYVLTIDTKTFCYDATLDMWHTRATGANDGSEISNCFAFFNNKYVIGGRDDGNLYEYDLDTYEDNGIIKRAIRACQYIDESQHIVFFHSLQIDFEMGVGLILGQGSDPVAMLEWSDDHCNTWSNGCWESMGKIGEYHTRAKWNMLGSSRNRVFRLIISDPVKRVITNAYIQASRGVS